jgi:hypothetical protein
MLTELRPTTKTLTVDEAARRLGIEPAAVRMFVRQRFLREAAANPPAVWESDVQRLHRIMLRRVTI